MTLPLLRSPVRSAYTLYYHMTGQLWLLLPEVSIACDWWEGTLLLADNASMDHRRDDVMATGVPAWLSAPSQYRDQPEFCGHVTSIEKIKPYSILFTVTTMAL